MSYTYPFPRPMLAVDVLVFARSGEQTQVLLIRRGGPPFQGQWAAPGGFVNMAEELEDAARRELREETGIDLDGLRQLGAFGKVGRDPRGRTISVVYWTMIDGPLPVRGGDDAAEARWFGIDALPDLAFDHHDILLSAHAAATASENSGSSRMHPASKKR